MFYLKDGKITDVKIQPKTGSTIRRPSPKFSFWTRKIRCSVCGKNYIRQTLHYVNGDTEYYWICGTGKLCEGRKNGYLWGKTIDETLDDVKEDVNFITAGLGRKLTVHFKDGSTKEIPWNKRKRHISQKKGE